MVRKHSEAGRYHISLGLNENDETIPISWKRSRDDMSYNRMSDDEQSAEITEVIANQHSLRERARNTDPTMVIGKMAITKLYDIDGDEEVIVVANTDYDPDSTHVFHPLEWVAFKEGIHEGEFD